MDKKDILKYLVIYIIIAMGINYFFSKRLNQEEIGTLVNLEAGKISVSRPMELDLNILKTPINKEFKIKKQEDDQIITKNTQNGEIEFSSFYGTPISFKYRHPITEKFITLFDRQSTHTPPLLLVINGLAITNYEGSINEAGDVIRFTTTVNKTKIVRTYTIKENLIESTLDIKGNGTNEIDSIQIISEEFSPIERDKADGFFSYHPEEKIIKLSEINSKPLLHAVILKPEITGFQSTYFSQAIIQKNMFDRAFLDIKTNDAMEKKTYYYLEKTEFEECSKEISLTFSWYCGAKILSSLKAADERLPLILEQGLFSKIANFLFFIISFLLFTFKNVGISLIIFALALKLLTIPFLKQIKESNQISKEYQQKLEYIKAKYHDDQKKKSEEELLLIKKYGIFPGFSARIPQILHIFIMISLPSFLKSNILFYQVPVGLWMHDASVPDKYFILPLFCLLFAYLQINDAKLTPMVKIAILIAIIIGMYAFSFLASGMQLFIVTGLVLSYFEKKFLLI
jgi:membrane protein insertase Oxa1/YidC/SpoIIIJ